MLGVVLVAACGDAGGGSTSGAEGSTSTEVSSSGAPTSEGSAEGTGTGSESTTSGGTESSGGVSSTESGEASSSGTTGAPAATIEEALDGIAGLTWEERESEIPGYRSFVLWYLQPADHEDPDGLQFTQHMTLMHRDAEAPMVISTDGYYIYPWYQGLAEPAVLLHANYLWVEHRFFAESRPEPADWSKLTIAQAAADHHRITKALKDAFYRAAWVSTGASKGGMTATYFRRFYPDDVDATVAYVAPMSFSVTDDRYWPYVQTIDGPCTQALTDFAREVLLRRPAMLARVEDEAAQENLDYTIITADQAVEVAALNVTWAFWQYGGVEACPQVPDAGASDAEVWSFLGEHMPPHDLADDRLLALEPYYFQSAVQLGGPETDEAALADLLVYPGFDVAPSYVVPGPTKDLTYDPAVMLDMKAWMASEAEAMLLVYGERDPWTAGAYEVDEANDVYRLVAPGANHGANIAGLAAEDRALAYARLEAWTGVKPAARELPAEPPLRLRVGVVR